jgi:hypothetical protein
MVRSFLQDPSKPVDGKCLEGETPKFEFDYSE